MKFTARVVGSGAAFLGLTGIILAAMGSHMVNLQALEGGATIWQTSIIIQLFQAAALVGFSAWLSMDGSRWLLWACCLMLLGALLFCGSLYLRVASGGDITGAAPVGGSIMMVGWLLAGISFWRKT